MSGTESHQGGALMETQAAHRSRLVPLKDYVVAQLKEINSPLNEWGAGEEFGHEPDQLERLLHYIHCGRIEQLCAAHSDDNVRFASRTIGCNAAELPAALREKVLVACFDFWYEAITNWQQQHGEPFPLKDFFPD